MGYYSSCKLSLICLPTWLFRVSVSSFSSSMSHWIYSLTMSKLWTRAYNSRVAVAGLLASPCTAGALHFLWILVQVLMSVMKADSAGHLQLEDGGCEANERLTQVSAPLCMSCLPLLFCTLHSPFLHRHFSGDFSPGTS